MATRTITTKLALSGDAEYRASIKAINAELGLHRSALERVTAEYAGQMNSMEALRAKETALSGTQEALAAKFKAQADMLEKAQEAQRAYRAEAADLQGQLDKLALSAEDTSKAEAELTEQLNKAQENMQKAANSVTAYQKELNYTARDQAKLEAELKQTRTYLEEAASSADSCAVSIDQYGKEVRTAKKETEDFGQELQQTGNAAENMGSRSSDAVGALAAAMAASGIKQGVDELIQAIEACVNASIEFESAMAGVQKVAKRSDEDLAAMAAGIRQMSTEVPVAATEIAAVAEAAARLGIAYEDILSFTRVMLDLGESSNLGAEEAATALARFANIAGTSSADYERLGSVIVALGNHFATSESEITSMASKLASAGTLAGLTEAEIMALSAAMSSVGIEAEAGGTAMTQTLTAMEKAVSEGGAQLEAFARIAGMSSSAFSEAWKGDAVSAVQAFISGLGGLDAAGESATEALEELGLSGVRQGNMLKSLALAAETLTATVETADEAWEKNTELAETAAARYETTASQMALLSNAADNAKIAIGDALAPALADIAEDVVPLMNAAADFVEQNPALVQAIAGAGTAILALCTLLGLHASLAAAAAAIQSTLNLSMSLCPAIAVAAAIGALCTMLGRFFRSAKDAEEASEDLNKALGENQAEAERLAGSAAGAAQSEEAAAKAAEAAAEAQKAAAEAAKAAEKAQKEAAKSAKELEKETSDLAGAADTLTKALKEQNEGGELSLKTALKLIDAGYGAALAIDQETGAITVNQHAYIAATKSKIADQIASLETQKQALQSARDLQAEEAAAKNLGLAYLAAAKAKIWESYAEDKAAIDTQIAALNKLSDELTSYTFVAETSARSSKTMQTQAQKDLAEYKNLVAELDHQRNLDAISERDYYTKLKEYRDRYLTDEDNLDEYRRITEQIYKYDKGLVDQEVDLWTEQTDALVSELEGRVKAVESQRDQLKDKLSGYGDLFTKDKNGNMSVENIQKDIDAMEAWADTIEGLKKRNISGSLMEEILGMDIDDATTFGQKLLSKSQEQFDKYNQLWETKQQRAGEISKQFFQDQIDSLGTEYNEKLDNALDVLTSTSFASGVDAVQGLIDGLASMEGALDAEIQNIVNRMDSILDSVYKSSGKIPSTAELSAQFESYSVRESVPATAQDIRESIAAGVNGIASIERPVYVTVESTMNVDSKRFFTETLPVQRAVARANPEVKSDR